MALDTKGNLYTLDVSDSRIRKISPAADVSTYAGTAMPGFADGAITIAQFRISQGGIAADSQGNIYGADFNNQRIRRISISGQVTTIAGSGISGDVEGDAGAAQFTYINDMVIDGQENLYVTDENRIRKISPQGIISTISGSSPGYADGDGASAKFNEPTGLGIDALGNIYVADIYNNRIRKISFE